MATPREALQRLLAATDETSLLRARADIGNADLLVEMETERVLGSVWETSARAVANVLFHPSLIRRSDRLTCLFRALEQREDTYLVLAAVVGLQAIDPDELDGPWPGGKRETHRQKWPPPRKRALEGLLEVIRLDPGVVAERASVTLGHMLRDDAEADQLVPLLDHENETVRHNLLVQLHSLLGNDESVRERIGSGDLPAEAKQRALRRYDELAASESRNVWLPVLAPIPDLDDCEE